MTLRSRLPSDETSGPDPFQRSGRSRYAQVVYVLFRVAAPPGFPGWLLAHWCVPRRCPACGPAAYARQQDTGFLNRTITLNGTDYHYVVYLPMDWTPKQKWPVILFLHGSGERGSDGLDETQVGLPNALRSHYERWPFVVVMPQVPYNHHHWTDSDIMAMAMDALNAEVKEFHGDPQRLYLTGMSLGGYGVWEIAKDYPGRFAAIAPVCGGIYWSYAPGRWHQPELVPEYVKAIGRTPVWIFHGADDPVVSPAQSQIMFAALSRCRGQRALLGVCQLSSQRLGQGVRRSPIAAVVPGSSPLRYRYH